MLSPSVRGWWRAYRSRARESLLSTRAGQRSKSAALIAPLGGGHLAEENTRSSESDQPSRIKLKWRICTFLVSVRRRQKATWSLTSTSRAMTRTNLRRRALTNRNRTRKEAARRSARTLRKFGEFSPAAPTLSCLLARSSAPHAHSHLPTIADYPPTTLPTPHFHRHQRPTPTPPTPTPTPTARVGRHLNRDLHRACHPRLPAL